MFKYEVRFTAVRKHIILQSFVLNLSIEKWYLLELCQTIQGWDLNCVVLTTPNSFLLGIWYYDCGLVIKKLLL